MPHEHAGMAAELLPDAILTIGLDSCIIFANRTAEALFGYGSGGMVGLTLAEAIIPPEMAAQHARGMAQYAKSRSGPVLGKRIEVVARDRSGRRFPIELAIYPDTSTEGRIIHAQIRDISERVARDTEGKAERDRFALFLDATADGWWDCEVGGATRYSDRLVAMQAAAGRDAASSAPSELSWIEPDDVVRVREAWRSHLEGAVGRYECTYRVRSADGEIRWMRDRGRAVAFALGRPTRIVGTTADVTEQQAAEQALENAKRLELLGLLAGGFAHDLNNLLTAISGQADIASGEPGTSPAVLESLESIRLASTKASMLTANMLALGRPRESQVRRLALRSSIEEIMRIAAIGLNRQIRLSVDASGVDDLEIEMDPGAFAQILLNLAVNARDAMPTGGTLRVEAMTLEGGQSSVGPLAAAIVVEDSGCGIPESVLARVFEPFFTTKPRGVGTGLGLAVVRQATAAAHGRVSVESAVGRGTRFVIELPAFRAARTEKAIPGRRPLRVVLAEDHALLRSMLADALRADGHEVADCSDGAMALERVLRPDLPPDVLILEAGLPSMGGFEVLAAAAARLGRAIPAVILTADPSVRLPGDAPRRVELMFKPFEVQSLLEAISRVMQAASV